MGSSVFGADSAQPTVIKAGKAILVVNDAEIIALNVQINYPRNVEVVPVLSKKRVISIGEPQGQFTAETILANGSDAFSAFKLDGNDCSPFDMKIKVSDNACDLNGKSVTAKNCFASSVNISAQGGRGFIGQGMQVTFTALEID